MARMLPPWPRTGTRSDAEKMLFRLLRDQLPEEDWTALHSVDLAVHERKPWTETDFVLVGPPGVFCLEVKGGTLSRRDRTWYSTDRNGSQHRLNESPFAQAGGAAAALRRFICDRARFFRSCLCVPAVGAPDAAFRVSGPDVIPEIVFDADDCDRSIAAYLDRVASYWNTRITEIRRGRPRVLGPDERIRIVELLAPDFELRRSLRAQLRESSDALLSLTAEQGRVLDGLAGNDRVLVEGGAGTGKTLLAVREAQRMAKDSQVLFTCFNRNLAASLRSMLDDAKGIDVIHFHSLLAKTVERAGMQSRIPDADDADLFEVFYPEVCVEALLQLDRSPYGALVVDEGQDLLLDSYLDVLDLLFDGGFERGRWRVFLDPNQSLFGGIASAGLARLRSSEAAQYRLSVNCRNTRPIAICTSIVSGLALSEVLRTDGISVEQAWYADARQQRSMVSRCVSKFIRQGVRPAEIVILSPYRIERSSVGEGLTHSCPPLVEWNASFPPHEASVIRFSTIGAFKGLESDVVVLVDVDDLKRLSESGALYVGTSRARLALSVFMSESERDAYSELAFQFGASLANSERELAE